MRVGVVSDTDNNLKNCIKIVELFNEAAVDRVIHTGDITQAKTLEVLSNLDAPMWGVYGNNDIGERESLASAASLFDFEIMDPPMKLVWAGRKVVVVHDPLELKLADVEDCDVVLHGHTHRQLIDYRNGRLTFNPGECAGHVAGFNAIGLLDLVEMKSQILNF